MTWREMFGNRDVYVLRPDGRMLVFVGDLTDDAPRSADVLRIAMTAMRSDALHAISSIVAGIIAHLAQSVR